MDIEKEALKFKDKKRKRAPLQKADVPFGPQMNRLEQYNGIKEGELAECMDPRFDHPVRKFDQVRVNIIEREQDGQVYFYFMKMGEPFRMKAERFVRVEQ